MNRVILLLNTGILVSMFLLALSATDSQIGLLQSASSIHSARQVMTPDRSVAFLKVVQSLDERDKLDNAKLEAIHDAVQRYYAVVRAAVAESRIEQEGDMAAVYRRISQEARTEVEHALATGFRADAAIRRVATQVIRVCA